MVLARKIAYGKTLNECLSKYKKLLVISVDNVGSKQLQDVRVALRGRAQILMGKNTIIRKIFRQHIDAGDEYAEMLTKLAPLIRLNIGFVFTNGDLAQIRKEILEFKVPASAKAGVVCPADVFIPAGPTGLDPGQTSFFQALNINTKITKGAIEITSKVHICKVDEKCTASASVLLKKLNIHPFFYGIKVTLVVDGNSVYPASVLDVDPEQLLEKFLRGVRSLASVSLGAYYPTAASLPHTFSNSIRMMIAISLMGEYSFKYAEPYKAFLGGKGDGDEEEEEEAAGDKDE